ncbi:hypothetical protein CAI21_08630 [Alkalilimnicola ehrlichii]|uniref:Uncharacterized protein n=1 Tax=Alkalilimnicola ehrlichii TaxID=351052 RepID=A0A3E0WUH0_9GAMM|nr:hypothetical protein CAI21_08630 [Alkalilimnicola ehrlichii]RFA36478.1 hypothetical protein CAL65_10900 [Alkalilimnicola ehrlichii]
MEPVCCTRQDMDENGKSGENKTCLFQASAVCATIRAVRDQTARQLATARQANDYAPGLNRRIYEVRGMLELARRLSFPPELLLFLEDHYQALRMRKKDCLTKQPLYNLG